jgi:RNA polymerase primary sigma factor
MTPTDSPVARSPGSSYFAAVGRVDRLDAAQERALAEELVRRRRVYWSAVLSDERHVAAVLDVIAAHCDDVETPAAGHEALVDRLVMADVGEACVAAIERVATACDLDWSRTIRATRRDYVVVRNQFVNANLRLVVCFAKRYGREREELADRIQEGNLGLMKAVERFDPARGVRFSTYAAWWIRHTITRALTHHSRTVRIPAHHQALFTKARHARPHLAVHLGREPSILEVAAAIAVDERRLENAELAMGLRTVALDAPAGDAGGRIIDELVAEDLPDPLHERDQNRLQSRAASALRELSAQERDILRQRFALDGSPVQTLSDIGDRIGLSRERIRQLQNKALDRLRTAIACAETRAHDLAA